MRKYSILVMPLAVALAAAATSAATIDFDALDNGEMIANQYAPFVTITSDSTVNGGASTDHLGPAAFDSSDPGPNDSGGDPDLLVNLGNVLMMQNPNFPATTGSNYDTPNDFAQSGSEGTTSFLFAGDVELLDMILVDINGGVLVDVVLTDSNSNTRTYFVPSMWTNDIDASGPDGYDLLDLTETSSAQLGEGGSSVPAPTEVGAFDSTAVRRLDVRIHGNSPSGAMDSIRYIPEPGTAILFGMGLLGVAARRRRN